MGVQFAFRKELTGFMIRRKLLNGSERNGYVKIINADTIIKTNVCPWYSSSLLLMLNVEGLINMIDMINIPFIEYVLVAATIWSMKISRFYNYNGNRFHRNISSRWLYFCKFVHLKNKCHSHKKMIRWVPKKTGKSS